MCKGTIHTPWQDLWPISHHLFCLKRKDLKSPITISVRPSVCPYIEHFTVQVLSLYVLDTILPIDYPGRRDFFTVHSTRYLLPLLIRWFTFLSHSLTKGPFPNPTPPSSIKRMSFRRHRSYTFFYIIFLPFSSKPTWVTLSSRPRCSFLLTPLRCTLLRQVGCALLWVSTFFGLCFLVYGALRKLCCKFLSQRIFTWSATAIWSLITDETPDNWSSQYS